MAKVRKGKLTDRELVVKAREKDALKARMDKLQKKIDAITEVVVEEMNLRGTHAIENDGIRVTLVQTTKVTYDEPSLRKALRKKWSLVTKTVFDPAALSREVQAGSIDPAVVDACSEVTYNKPYFRLSDV